MVLQLPDLAFHLGPPEKSLDLLLDERARGNGDEQGEQDRPERDHDDGKRAHFPVRRDVRVAHRRDGHEGLVERVLPVEPADAVPERAHEGDPEDEQKRELDPFNRLGHEDPLRMVRTAPRERSQPALRFATLAPWTNVASSAKCRNSAAARIAGAARPSI